MNARIQVEHTVTEMRVDRDLLQAQLYLMQHDKLPFSQDDIVFNGHVIEARINAENPEKKFQPTPGKVKSYIYLKVSTYVSILCFILGIKYHLIMIR